MPCTITAQFLPPNCELRFHTFSTNGHVVSYSYGSIPTSASFACISRVVPKAGTITMSAAWVGAAVNEGKLFREVNRKAEVVRDISTLVGLLTEDADPELDPEPEADSKSGFFFGLFGKS